MKNVVPIIRIAIISFVLYTIMFLVLVSSFDADLLFSIVPFVCIIVAFFINKSLSKRLLDNKYLATVDKGNIMNVKVTKATFVKLCPISLPISIIFVFWLADTPYFSYSDKYQYNFHLLNGRDFIQTPTIMGIIFILVSSIICTYLLTYLHRGVKRVFSFQE